MNRRERVLAALNFEEPDQVPTHVIYLDANNVDNVLGKPEKDDFQTVKQIQEDHPDDWLEQLNNLAEELESSIFARMVEAVLDLGLDTTQIGIVPFEYINDHEMRDIFGRIWELQNNAGNFYPFYKYGTVNSIEKWEVLKQNLEEQATPKYCKMAKRYYRRINKKYKDDVLIMVTNDLAGIFESAWQGLGIEFFSKQLYSNPEFISEVFNAYTDFTIAWDNAYLDAGAEVFVESADLAFKTGPFMSPKLFNELLLPCYQRLTDAVHERKGKIILHSDGHITPLLDFIVDSGFDGLHSLEPTAGVDLAVVKKKVGTKLCLLGNIDTGKILTKGNKAQVDAAVKYAIQTAGSGGGFILSASNMHPAIPIQNLQWMVEAAHRFGQYPLPLK